MKNPSPYHPVLVISISLFLCLLTGINARAQNYYEVLKAVASDEAPGNSMGVSVSVAGDIAFVGANGEDEGATASGAVYIFQFINGTWKETQKLKASDAADYDNFGAGVSVSGSWAIVGANQNDDAGNGSGSAYIFELSGGTWLERQKITASDAESGDQFGFSVGISGNAAIVSSHLDDDGGDMAGSAYIFEYNGSSWIQSAKLTASDAAEWDQFGNRVGISEDWVIIGNAGNDDNGMNSGSAYIFHKDGTIWSEEKKLIASDAHENDHFGTSVAISGSTAIIGANGVIDASRNAGAVYIFDLVNENWVQTQHLVSPDPGPNDNFGSSVSISGDKAIIGAFWDDEVHIKSGAAYIFINDGSSWTGGQKLLASDAARDDWFGNAVSISGENAIVGARGKGESYSIMGAAYIYKQSSSGIDNPASLNHVGIYPNPASDIVNINFGSLHRPTVKLYTSQGKLVLEKNNVDTNNFSIQLNSNSHIYILEIISHNEIRRIKLLRK